MRIYEDLWSEAVAAFDQGQPRVDPHLLDLPNDHRRGVSLVFRPPPAVQARVADFLHALAAEFPNQYFYQPRELHVTVLTYVPATELWRREMGEVRAFRALTAEVAGRHRPFPVAFRGVTAAPNAVMIQGFPLDGGLDDLRAELRRVFVERGFPGRLDRRYPNRAAHVTAMRFARSEADWQRLKAIVAANRQTDFGRMRVDTLELLWSDWYASAASARTFQKFSLPEAPGAGPETGIS